MISIGLAIVFILAVTIIVALVAFLVHQAAAKKILLTHATLETEYNRLLPFEQKHSDLLVANEGLRHLLEAEKSKNQWLNTAETTLKDTFNALAASALNANRSQFADMNSREIKSIVEPLLKDLGKLEVEVNLLETNRKGAYEGLIAEIGNLKRSQDTMTTTAAKLQEALKSNTVRGKWGELQLKRIVEISGLAEHIDFEEQVIDSEGLKPDMIVHLPNGGNLPVDAKAPMSKYLEAFECQDPLRRQTLLAEHSTAVQNHIKKLSEKSYWNNINNAADFVVMFIPYESGLQASFASDPGVLEFALNRKVVIVTPSTLLALLKIVALGWMQVQLSQNAKEIAAQGKEIIGRVSTFLGHMTKLGKNLTNSVECYNNSVASLDSRVLPAVKKLQELGGGAPITDIPMQIEQQTRVPRQPAEDTPAHPLRKELPGNALDL